MLAYVYYISTTKNYREDLSTTYMVKAQLSFYYVMIGYPINPGPTHPCMQNCFSKLKKS